MLFRWNLLIVHIVPVAAIRKSILVKGIVSEPWPAGGPNPPGRGGLPADGSFYGRRIRSDSRSTDSCKRTIDVEAGGNAMRRPPEVGLVVLLLLGTSGCAGFQRLNGLPSDAPRSDGDKASSARFSWWGPRAPRGGGSADSEADLPATSQPAPHLVATGPSGDVWPESQSEWMARNFPRISRLWKQDTTHGRHQVDDQASRSQASRGTPRSGDATAAAARADGEVHPADSRAVDDPPAAAANPSSQPSRRRQPPRTSAHPVVTSPPHSLPESTGDVYLDVSGASSRPGAAPLPTSKPTVRPRQI